MHDIIKKILDKIGKTKIETKWFPSKSTWFERLFQPLLQETNSTKTIQKLWSEIILESIIVTSIVGIVLSFQTSNFYITVGCLAAFLAPIGFWFFFLLLKSEHQKRRKEDQVADLLLSCSAFPKGTDTITLLRFGASNHFGLLGNEFEIVCAEIKAGASIENALYNVKKRCKSKVLDRMVDLLVLGYESGADLSTVFRETAEDLFETRFLLQERHATLLVEKYTILVAGGLIVPIVLGLVSGMMQQLDFSALEGLEIGLNSVERDSLQAAALLGTHFYLVAYALIAAFFVGHQEGNWKKGILYAAILVPVGLLGFYLAKGG